MNEEKIKVYLQYPWKFPDSPYYKYLLQDSPEGIEYLNTKKQKGVITKKKFFIFSTSIKRIIRKTAKIIWPSMLNSHKSPKGDYDLIHCAHCLSKNKDKPWIADMEGIISIFVSTKDTQKGIKKLNKTISRGNCKKILPWTEHTKKEIETWIPKYKNKLEVVYPALPLKVKKKKFGKKITLLFVGRYFYLKGGLHALETMDVLTKKYNNIEAICISEVPEEIKQKYSQNKKIKIYGLMPQKEVFEIYKKSDILIYPGYSDSFGFAYLEAMSFGIPIVTVDGYARKELIEDGKNGFVINRPSNFLWADSKKENNFLTNKILKRTSLLIENKNLLRKMSKNCIELIKEGKFSIKERNKKLKRIYEEAIK